MNNATYDCEKLGRECVRFEQDVLLFWVENECKCKFARDYALGETLLPFQPLTWVGFPRLEPGFPFEDALRNDGGLRSTGSVVGSWDCWESSSGRSGSVWSFLWSVSGSSTSTASWSGTKSSSRSSSVTGSCVGCCCCCCSGWCFFTDDVCKVVGFGFSTSVDGAAGEDCDLSGASDVGVVRFGFSTTDHLPSLQAIRPTTWRLRKWPLHWTQLREVDKAWTISLIRVCSSAVLWRKIVEKNFWFSSSLQLTRTRFVWRCFGALGWFGRTTASFDLRFLRWCVARLVGGSGVDGGCVGVGRTCATVLGDGAGLEWCGVAAVSGTEVVSGLDCNVELNKLSASSA